MTSVLCPRIRVMPTCPLTFLADPSVTGKDPREGNSLPQFLIIFIYFLIIVSTSKKSNYFCLKNSARAPYEQAETVCFHEDIRL